MRKVGIVGCGLIGRAHALGLEGLVRSGLAELAVARVYDRDADRAAAFGAPAAATLDEFLDAVDVVWVCTWTGAHIEAVEAASARGLPVFCEKPLARSYAESLAVAASLRTVPHQVGLVLRYVPSFRTIAERVRSGAFGRPMGAVFRDDQYFPITGSYGSTWRADVAAAGAGTLLEHSIHDVDVLTWIFGLPAQVSARTSNFAGHQGIEDLAAVTLSYADGHASSLVSVWHRIATRGSSRRLEVFCEDALFWLDDEAGPVHVETSDGHDVVETPLHPRLDLVHVPRGRRGIIAALALEDMAFLDALGRGEGGAPTVDDALSAHAIVDAAYRSAADGGVPVTVDRVL
jgi:predicted dehydrogenase